MHRSSQTRTSKFSRDTYVTPDGLVREDDFQIHTDTHADDEELEDESDEPVPLAVGGRRQPVWYYAGKLKQLAADNKVSATNGHSMATECAVTLLSRCKKRSITSTTR